MNKLKILELTNYSAGICGVWQRVKQESIELHKKGYNVMVFTTNAIKGCDEIAPPKEILENIKIKRFPFKKLGGESFMHWEFKQQALEFEPDIIIAHSYRHPHTIQALKIRDRLVKSGKKCKVFLVTHAPFIEKNITRSFFQKIAIHLYDFFIGKPNINKFDKIITITKWEEAYLHRLGIDKEKLVYIPNGIPEDFFKHKIKNGKNLLFLGRVSPIKDLEILIQAMNGSDYQLDIVGPSEEQYKRKLIQLIKNLKLSNIHFKPPVYDLNSKISLIDKYDIFILPSKREAMPQSLIEAMARGKIVISSDNPGSREIISHNQNGFLFKVGDFHELSHIIDTVKSMGNKKRIIQKNAIRTAEKFNWNKLISKLTTLF